jgi:hypothetical protein
LNTKQIVNSLKKFKKKYYSFKTDWESGNLWAKILILIL